LSKNYLEKSAAKVNISTAWKILACCFVIGCIGYSIRNSFGVFFKSFEIEFGLNRTVTSGILSAAQIVGCITCVFMGKALDRFSPRTILLICGILTASGLILTSQSDSLWQIYIAYSLLIALGTSALNVVFTPTVTSWFTHNRGIAIAIVTSSVSLSMVFSPLFAFIIDEYSWKTAFLILALVTLAVWVPSALLLKKSPDQLELSKANDHIENKNQHNTDLTKTLKNKQFWYCTGIFFSHGFCIYIILTHVINYALDRGLASVQSASIMSLIGVGGLVGRLVLGKFVDKNIKKLAIITTIIMAISFCWLVIVYNEWTLYLFALVFGFGYGGSAPVFLSVVIEYFGTSKLATILGILLAIYTIGSAFGATFAGFIFDIQGKYTLAFLICSVILILSLWPIIILKKIKIASA
jgi:MFS family permease